VVVCRTGRRSDWGGYSSNAGFENVTSMAGGVKEWKASDTHRNRLNKTRRKICLS
jgi:rhodanese-related sulfurtransferase